MTTIQELRGKRNYVEFRDHNFPEASSGSERDFLSPPELQKHFTGLGTWNIQISVVTQS